VSVTVSGSAPTAAQAQQLRSALDLAPGVLSYYRPMKVAFAGDSIALQYSQRDGTSPLWWAATFLYPCEYVTTLTSAVGGTSSTHLISTQIAQLEALSAANMPDVVVVQSLQNDFFNTQVSADSFVDNLRQYATRALAAGVKLVALCARPPKSGVGTDVPSGIMAANRLLEKFCRDTPGCYFVDVFSVWRRNVYSEENAGASAKIDWFGTGITDPASYTVDGTHPNFLASRAAASLFLPILQKFARPVTMMPAAAAAYDNTNFPYSNILGRNGLFDGTAGTLNGSLNTGVAGVSTGTRDFWALTTSNGVTVTPTIVTDAQGYRSQQWALSGTASADALLSQSIAFALAAVDGGNFIIEARCELENVTGLKILQMVANAYQPIIDGGTNQLFPDTFSGTLILRSPVISAPAGFGGFSTFTTSLTATIKSGKTAAGNIRWSRVGWYRV
jgi:lysophospholipase L1-like esterase